MYSCCSGRPHFPQAGSNGAATLSTVHTGDTRTTLIGGGLFKATAEINISVPADVHCYSLTLRSLVYLGLLPRINKYI